MIYRNVKTGVVIKTTSKVVGKKWQPVEEPAKQPEPVDLEMDDTEDTDDIEDTEETEVAAAEESEAPKKTGRRGKK